MSLLRWALGTVLRRLRHQQGRTLREVAAAAGVALQYLSEVERGRKEVSSELLAAICAALGVALPDVLAEVRAELLRTAPSAVPHRRPPPPVCRWRTVRTAGRPASRSRPPWPIAPGAGRAGRRAVCCGLPVAMAGAGRAGRRAVCCGLPAAVAGAGRVGRRAVRCGPPAAMAGGRLNASVGDR